VGILYVQDGPPTPLIRRCSDGGVASYQVTVDGQQILAVPAKSFQMAVQCWCAAFWVFHLQYPSRLQKFCCFVEKALLNRKGRVPAIVTKWANRLLA